jgi:hypothetical protein
MTLLPQAERQLQTVRLEIIDNKDVALVAHRSVPIADPFQHDLQWFER